MRCVIIGGGAAGFFGAIQCAESNPDCEVIIFEKGPRVLTKVQISGGGRCNVTHACFDPKKLTTHYPRGSRELLGPFHTWQPSDTEAWFSNRGVPLKTETDGRMFPETNTSKSIIHCLLNEADKLGTQIRKRVGIHEVQKQANGTFLLKLSDESELTCDKLLIATGGSQGSGGHTLAESLGHTIIPLVPSLFTFNIKDSRIDELQGISVPEASLSISGTKLSEKGPLLITHWGLSGPAVLRLSAWGARTLHERGYAFDLYINWLGKRTYESVLETLTKQKQSLAKKYIFSNPQFGLPQRLWERLSHAAGCSQDLKWADISKKYLTALAKELTEGVYSVMGKSTFKEEFVTCGGVKLSEVNFKTMESKECPGLHFAGEVLDIDGITGGFNFQSAWTTGTLAGRAMAMTEA